MAAKSVRFPNRGHGVSGGEVINGSWGRSQAWCRRHDITPAPVCAGVPLPRPTKPERVAEVGCKGAANVGIRRGCASPARHPCVGGSQPLARRNTGVRCPLVGSLWHAEKMRWKRSGGVARLGSTRHARGSWEADEKTLGDTRGVW